MAKVASPRRKLATPMGYVHVIVATWALAGMCFAQSTNPTKDVECSELNPGRTVQYKTDSISNSRSTVRAYATIEVTRAVTDKNAESCLARYKLFVAQGRESFTLVKAFSDRSEWMVGAQIIGFSPDQSKLAADFWWAGGDYTGHRPVIYDVNTKRVQFRELGEQITGQLPSCDYFQNFTGVTNSGEAIIHVPKSIYVDEGCPDQGDWLFDAANGKVRRAEAVAEVPTIVVKQPTVVAFFPPVDTATIDDDTNEALSDFQFYAQKVREPLRKAGIDFHELYTHSFTVRVGYKMMTFHPGKVEIGYYFVAPGKEPRVEYGVMTDDDLLHAAKEYFGTGMK